MAHAHRIVQVPDVRWRFANSYAYSNPDTNPDANTNSNSNADSDANTYANSDSDAGAKCTDEPERNGDQYESDQPDVD